MQKEDNTTSSTDMPLDTIQGGTTTAPRLIRKMENLKVDDGELPTLSSAAIDRMRGISEAENKRQRSTITEESTSQVSVGSVGPTLAALLPSKHLDLTPVMRNTTGGNAHGIISPDDDDDELQGENLALPSDLSSYDDSGPVLPPLRAIRHSSAGHINTEHLKMAFRRGNAHQNHEPPQLPAAVPMDRKAFTFTSREEYEEHHHPKKSLPEEDNHAPYQPTRQDSDLNMERPDAEELDSIFIQRRNHSEESEKNHRLEKTIPLEERQFSIPSLRMAHHLRSSGSLSQTECTDDEESQIVFIQGAPAYGRDDESLSSRDNSSLYMGDDIFVHTGEVLGGPIEPSSFFPPRVIGEASGDKDSTDGAIDGYMDERRKRKHQEREERAAQWLHSVEGDQNCVAEAASSKFLNSSARPIETDVSQPLAFRRQASTPAKFANLKGNK